MNTEKREDFIEIYFVQSERTNEIEYFVSSLYTEKKI